MKRIGLTGGIGSGKSIIAKIFGTLDVPIYDSDKAAKELIHTNSQIKTSIVNLFGKEAYQNDIYNREFIARVVFKDADKLKVLNSIVHPVVREHFKKWSEVQKGKGKSYCIKEAAILFESGAAKDLDAVIAVVAPADVRLKRVVKRDSLEAKQVEQRMSNQLSTKELIEKSDYVIHNGDQDMIIPQILTIHSTLSSA